MPRHPRKTVGNAPASKGGRKRRGFAASRVGSKGTRVARTPVTRGARRTTSR